MKVFSSDSRAVEMWGPSASTKVKVSALGSVIENTWMLKSFRIGMREITDIRQCFNDVSYIYALGLDQGSCRMTLEFVIFIGKKNCQGGDHTSTLDSGVGDFVSNRISKNTAATNITIGSFSGSGWLVGLTIGDVDASKGLCYGTAEFIVQIG